MIKKYIESEMYKTLKCSGQMLDAILKEQFSSITKLESQEL